LFYATGKEKRAFAFEFRQNYLPRTMAIE
jgi:hypothetical protein